MQCPVCENTLTTIIYEGIHIETCASCGGEWLDGDELKHVVAAREVLFSPEEVRAIANAQPLRGVKLADEDRDLLCPKCGGETDAVNYGGDSGIIIDRCTGCRGFWLDAEELERIQQLVEGWEADLEGDLVRFGPKLDAVAEDVAARLQVSPSRFRFLNALINRVIDYANA